MDVLTVVENQRSEDENLICRVGQYEGAAGHVLVTYSSGGGILASMGHWIELMKIDTSAEKLLSVAEREYGSEKASYMRNVMSSMSESEETVYRQETAQLFIQSQAPGMNEIMSGRKDK